MSASFSFRSSSRAGKRRRSAIGLRRACRISRERTVAAQLRRQLLGGPSSNGHTCRPDFPQVLSETYGPIFHPVPKAREALRSEEAPSVAHMNVAETLFAVRELVAVHARLQGAFRRAAATRHPQALGDRLSRGCRGGRRDRLSFFRGNSASMFLLSFVSYTHFNGRGKPSRQL